MDKPTGSNGGSPAVSCVDVTVAYGHTIAVDNLSFEASRGKILAILGPNGAGKTSTVESLEGYRVPQRGQVRVLGHDPAKGIKQLSPSIGVMLQEGGVHPMMSPRDAAELFAGYYRAAMDPGEIIGLVGLEDVARTPYKRLSGGEKQRLSLGLALMGRPIVVFLDEPTAGVDPQGRLGIRQVILQLRSQGTCIILTTHELPEAERLADEVLILDRGKKVMQGTIHELLATSQGNTSVRFHTSAAVDIHALARAIGTSPGEIIEEAQASYRVDGDATPGRIAAITSYLAEHDIFMDRLTTGTVSLEEAYLSLIGSPVQ
ncbi:MAG: ABC transporter ATP-binding protein [Actinobacteria bacterium]|nr:ABC transporter ATP-binding protein [Actinomycetota bacterium]MCL5446518.1 ABC transporter ATP-binding protein [Actinomycetota bacterium]